MNTTITFTVCVRVCLCMHIYLSIYIFIRLPRIDEILLVTNYNVKIMNLLYLLQYHIGMTQIGKH